MGKDVMLGRVPLPNKEGMSKEAKRWGDREDALASDEEGCAFQTDYIVDLYHSLANPLEYVDDANKLDYFEEFMQWEHDKHADILSYRDKSFTSKVSGVTAVSFGTPW